jgi:aspartate aminotransferase
MPDVQTLLAALVLTTRTLGSVNAPVIGQRLAAELLDETVDLSIYDSRRKLMAKVLSNAGIEFPMPAGAFYFFAKSPVADEMKFVDALLEEKILVVTGKGFGYPGYIRLSCSVDEQIIARSEPGFKRAMERLCK